MRNYGSRASQISRFRCTWEEEPTIPGFYRFSSADPRFPVSIACPEDKSPVYDFNRAQYLHVDFSNSNVNSFVVVREDLALYAKNGDREAAEVVSGRRNHFWLMEQAFARKRGGGWFKKRYRITKRESEFVPVGRDGFGAPFVALYDEDGEFDGETVFFAGREPSALWQIIWNPRGGYDQPTFRQVLSSFRWLDADWFRSISMFA